MGILIPWEVNKTVKWVDWNLGLYTKRILYVSNKLISFIVIHNFGTKDKDN